jgi:hypothetical protein
MADEDRSGYGRRITSGELAGALWEAGILPQEPSAYQRIVIELGPDYDDPVRIYAELLADDRWLRMAPLVTGVQVITSPPDSPPG